VSAVIRTVLTTGWGLRHPIVLAPMGGWSGGALAGAVSAAGGLGMIGVTSNAPQAAWIAQQAAIARPQGAFGIGLMVWMLERRPELLDAALAERPAVVSLSFGDPAGWTDRVHAAGARVVSQVSDVPSAERALAAGVDAVVAQGTDAGGHCGPVGTLPLLQVVLDVAERDRVPVLAAGGIVTGAGVAAALAAGAAGAWVGTRFMATPEALGSAAAKAKLLAASERDTVRTSAYDRAMGIPWPPEYPGRALRSGFTERWHGREDELAVAAAEAPGEVAAALAAEPVVDAGQGVAAVRELLPAGEVVRRLAAETERRLRAVASALA
jgi:nitronate monooxygenase